MKAHRTDGVSLTFAALFFAIVAWWVVAQIVDIHVPAAGWWVAFGLIVLGLLGLVGAIRSARNARTAERAAAPSEQPVSGGTTDAYPSMESDTAQPPRPVSPAQRGQSGG